MDKCSSKFSDKYEKLALTEIQQVFNLQKEDLSGYYKKFVTEVNNSHNNGVGNFWCALDFYTNEKIFDVYKALALARALSLDHTWQVSSIDNTHFFDLDWMYSNHIPLIKNMSSDLLRATVALLRVNKELIVGLDDTDWIREQYNNFALTLLENVANSEIQLSLLSMCDFIPYNNGLAGYFVRLLRSEVPSEIMEVADNSFREAIQKSDNEERERLIRKYVYSVDESIRDPIKISGVRLRSYDTINKELFCSQLAFIFENKMFGIADHDEYFNDVKVYFLITDECNHWLRRRFLIYLSQKKDFRCSSVDHFNKLVKTVKDEFGDNCVVMAKLEVMTRKYEKQRSIQQQTKAERMEREREEMENNPFTKLCERLSN